LVGVLLIAVGTVWTIQGYGTLKGSFMTGSPLWMWIGIACVGAGVLVLVATFAAGRRSPRRS
jgi:hypothetical protein